MTDRLDIFEVLKKIDSRDVSFFEGLSPELQKTFAPIIVNRWFSSGSDIQLYTSAYIMNPLIFSLHKHSNFLYKLLVACSDGKKKQYKWIKKKSKDKSKSMSDKIISEYYQCSRNEASKCRKRLTKDDIIDMAEEMGYTVVEIKKIKDEWK